MQKKWGVGVLLPSGMLAVLTVNLLAQYGGQGRVLKGS